MITRLGIIISSIALAAGAASSATVFGIVCSKGSPCAGSSLGPVAVSLGAGGTRVNMPLLIGLTDTSLNPPSTYYPSAASPLSNTIPGAVGAGGTGTFAVGEQLIQNNTLAAATVNVVPGAGVITVGAVGQPNGLPANATDTWVDGTGTNGNAGSTWVPSGAPAIVPTYSWRFSAPPTGWQVGDTVTSWALSPDGTSRGTSTIDAIFGGGTVRLVNTGPPLYVGISPTSDPLTQIQSATNSGLKTHAVMFNSCGDTINTNCPIRTDIEYTSELTETLNYIASLGYPLRTFSVESEEDSFLGSQATAAQYLHELALGTQIGHSLDYTVYNGGFATVGLNALWWYYNFYYCGTTACRQAADAAAPNLFVKTAKQLDWSSTYIPTACFLSGFKANGSGNPQASSGWNGSISNGVLTLNAGPLLAGTVLTSATNSGVGDVIYTQGQPPGITVLSQLTGTGCPGACTGQDGTYQLSAGALNTGVQPVYMNTLTVNRIRTIVRTWQTLAGFAAIPYDFTNYHWYQTSPVVEMPVISWYLAQAGGKPLTLEENGTYSQSGADVVDHLKGALSYGPDAVYWWNSDAGDGSGAVALTDPLNNIRPNGWAFRNYITATPGPHGPDQIGDAVAPAAPSC